MSTFADNINVIGTISATGALSADRIYVQNGIIDSNSNAVNWDASYNTLTANSGDWESVYNTVFADSGKWDSNYTTVSTKSARWENAYTTTLNNSGKWDSNYTTVSAKSARWENAYTTTSDKSANWDNTYTSVFNTSANWDSAYKLKNEGGLINGDLVINGSLTALSSATFYNTVFTTTSALSVYNIGGGPGLVVKQAAVLGDIASFYDLDTGTEVLHVGDLSRVGINTSDPTVTGLTVSGEISASGQIRASNINNSNWDSVYTTTSNKSSNWDNSYTKISNSSANWDNTYSKVNSSSANWDSVYTTTSNKSANWDSSYTTTLNNSSNWSNTYTTVNTKSANWDNAYNKVNTSSANWDSVYNTTLNNSGGWANSTTWVQNNSANLSAVSVSAASISASGAIRANNLSATSISGIDVRFNFISATGVSALSLSSFGAINGGTISGSNLRGTTVSGTSVSAINGFVTGTLSADILSANTHVGTNNSFNAQTASYVLQSTDNGKVITLSGNTDLYLSVPAGLNVGFSTMFIQLGTGQINISAGAGVTVNSYSNYSKTAGQYAGGSLVCYTSNTYVLAGSLA
jgi:hypothetical protein